MCINKSTMIAMICDFVCVCTTTQLCAYIACIFIYLSIYLFIYLCIYLLMYLFIYVFIHLFIYLFIYLLFTYEFIYLSNCHVIGKYRTVMINHELFHGFPRGFQPVSGSFTSKQSKAPLRKYALEQARGCFWSIIP